MSDFTIEFYGAKKPLPLMKEGAKILVLCDNDIITITRSNHKFYYGDDVFPKNLIKFWALLPGQAIKDIVDVEAEKLLTPKQQKALQIKEEKEAKAFDMAAQVLDYVNEIIAYKQACRVELKIKGKKLDAMIKEIKKVSRDTGEYFYDFLYSERFESFDDFAECDDNEYEDEPTYTVKNKVKASNFAKFLDNRRSKNDDEYDEYGEYDD